MSKGVVRPATRENSSTVWGVCSGWNLAIRRGSTSGAFDAIWGSFAILPLAQPVRRRLPSMEGKRKPERKRKFLENIG